MFTAQKINQQQRDRWNGFDGQFWVQQQRILDRVLSPISEALLKFAAPQAGSTILDIGCGCGGTTVELARIAGPQGRVVALDISEPMLAVTAERVKSFANTRCLLGDAAQIDLKSLAADLILSRFGVMFFGDPVSAFKNIRRALRPAGRLRLVVWREMQENPWMQLPAEAVFEHTPRLPKPEPNEPGPNSFADRERVTEILTSAGFSAPIFTPLDISIDVAGGGTLDEAVYRASQMGLAKRALADQPDHIRAAALESIRRALIPYATSAGVIMPAALWLIAAE